MKMELFGQLNILQRNMTLTQITLHRCVQAVKSYIRKTGLTVECVCERERERELKIEIFFTKTGLIAVCVTLKVF